MSLRTIFLVFAMAFGAASAAVAAQRPNVIIVLADDLGYGDVGWTHRQTRQGPAIATPNLDRLAREGVRLSAHYAAAPVCAPSRASLLTGVRQDHCSVRDNMFDHPLREPATLGTVMRSAGYSTIAVGKWGLAGGGQSRQPVSAHPLDKGFDRYYGFLDHLAGHTYYHYHGYLDNAYMGLWENREQATASGSGVYSTDLFIARAKHEIGLALAAGRARPFFLFLAVNTVHGSGRCDETIVERHPLHVPGRPYPEAGVTWPVEPEPREQRNTWIDPQYRGLSDENMRRYATAITRLDTAIGDLLRFLERSGVADNTVIIFTSDNGPADEYGADPRFFGSAGPFDGFKRDVYEGGLRVPTFVWRCGGFAVHEDDEPSISTDWMATLADIAGVAPPPQCEGVSLLPRWRGEKGSPSTVATAYRGGRESTAAFREFAARKGQQVRGAQRMRREGNLVYLQTGGTNQPWRVYDIIADPHQDRPVH